MISSLFWILGLTAAILLVTPDSVSENSSLTPYLMRNEEPAPPATFSVVSGSPSHQFSGINVERNMEFWLGLSERHPLIRAASFDSSRPFDRDGDHRQSSQIIVAQHALAPKTSHQLIHRLRQANHGKSVYTNNDHHLALAA